MASDNMVIYEWTTDSNSETNWPNVGTSTGGGYQIKYGDSTSSSSYYYIPTIVRSDVFTYCQLNDDGKVNIVKNIPLKPIDETFLCSNCSSESNCHHSINSFNYVEYCFKCWSKAMDDVLKIYKNQKYIEKALRLIGAELTITRLLLDPISNLHYEHSETIK